LKQHQAVTKIEADDANSQPLQLSQFVNHEIPMSRKLYAITILRKIILHDQQNGYAIMKSLTPYFISIYVLRIQTAKLVPVLALVATGAGSMLESLPKSCRQRTLCNLPSQLFRRSRWRFRRFVRPASSRINPSRCASCAKAQGTGK
jgi:hypothetical protein